MHIIINKSTINELEFELEFELGFELRFGLGFGSLNLKKIY